MRIIRFILLLITCHLGSYAQNNNFNDTVYYLSTFEKVGKKYAEFYRVPAIKKDSIHYEVRYYKMDGTPALQCVLIPALIEYHYSLEMKVAIKDGKYILYNGDGKLSMEGYYVNNIMHGYWKNYSDGVLKSEGEFRNDVMVKEWKFYKNGYMFLTEDYSEENTGVNYSIIYNSNKKKMAEGYYVERVVGGKKKQLRTSTWVYYYNNTEKVKKSLDYLDGELNGPYMYYDSITGNKIINGKYLHGNKDSIITRYYSDGKLKVLVHYNNGVLEGEYIKYDDSLGKILEKGNYHNGKLEGVWKTYYYATDIVKEESHYKDGIGDAIVYDYKTGKKKAEGKYVDDNKESVWTYYSKDGKMIAIENYHDGELNGEAISFDENGNRISIVNYAKGMKNGKWQTMYEGGTKKWFVAEFTNDTINGVLESFYDSGKIKRKQVYEHGSLVSGECYSQSGDVILCVPFVRKAEFVEDVMNYIGRNLKYPQQAIDNKIEGKVLVGFKILENGKVVDVRVINSLNEDCDDEAIRLVSQMPSWVPARIDDIPYESNQTLPIVFWIH